jgi:hypothetical protein
MAEEPVSNWTTATRLTDRDRWIIRLTRAYVLDYSDQGLEPSEGNCEDHLIQKGVHTIASERERLLIRLTRQYAIEYVRNWGRHPSPEMCEEYLSGHPHHKPKES